MSKLGTLINELVQLNIWRYHPPGANPTNGDIIKYEKRIAEIVDELNEELEQKGESDE